jgi:hypothetical protein
VRAGPAIAVDVTMLVMEPQAIGVAAAFSFNRLSSQVAAFVFDHLANN